MRVFGKRERVKCGERRSLWLDGLWRNCEDFFVKSSIRIVLALIVVSPGFGVRAATPSAASRPTSAPTAHITAPPIELGLSPSYRKYVDANQIPVVSSDKVPDAALLEARDIVLHMLSKRDDVRREMVRHKIRVAIMASSEVTTDVPEHSDLNEAFPHTDWNQRCRGVGATIRRPASSAAEENLLAEPHDRYHGESIMVHEFSHSMVTMGVQFVDKDFDQRLKEVYRSAMRDGLWSKTYAASNAEEYWAEGVQDWFDTNQKSDPPNGIHNAIHTREQLRKYDPKLARLIESVFRDDAWRCPYGSNATSREKDTSPVRR